MLFNWVRAKVQRNTRAKSKEKINKEENSLSQHETSDDAGDPRARRVRGELCRVSVYIYDTRTTVHAVARRQRYYTHPRNALYGSDLRTVCVALSIAAPLATGAAQQDCPQ